MEVGSRWLMVVPGSTRGANYGFCEIASQEETERVPWLRLGHHDFLPLSLFLLVFGADRKTQLQNGQLKMLTV